MDALYTLNLKYPFFFSANIRLGVLLKNVVLFELFLLLGLEYIYFARKK